MSISTYPEFTPVSLELQTELQPKFNRLSEGISEFTFAGIYLFRNTYQYEIAYLDAETLILKGTKDGKVFYALPMGFPKDRGLAKQLLEEVDYVKGLSEPHADDQRVWLEQHGYEVCEDRDNFDYLYHREDLATLKGKKYHKKRNQVNAFLNNYEYEEQCLSPENIEDAYQILEDWRAERDDPGDYSSAKEALDLHETLGLTGYIIYVDGRPAAYCMGEEIALGSTYVIHIEKAIGSYKGIYQFINQAFAAVLPQDIHFINREQDLGDPGLRQAKMTYRPAGFVKKYRVCPTGTVSVPFHTLCAQDQQG